MNLSTITTKLIIFMKSSNTIDKNNVMEITAVIEGLKLLKEPCDVQIYSDSAYVVNAFNQGWIYNWMKNGWKTSGKDPVKNKELWQELYALTKKHKVEFIKATFRIIFLMERSFLCKRKNTLLAKQCLLAH